MFCGITGIPVWGTAQAIIASPGTASDIIAAARTASTAENATLNAGAAAGAASGGVAGVTGNAYNPFAGKAISDGFGARGGEHKGIDYPMPVGTPLPAAIAGTVSTTTSGGSGGYIATITASNGYSVEYMHCSRFVPNINGAKVVPGQIIAYSGGAAGAAGAGDSTGPHVHFQVNQPNGTPINPQTYFGS
jgi:murein DD-endopeptidase MepM/ murein hydrolase activator NlpD